MLHTRICDYFGIEYPIVLAVDMPAPIADMMRPHMPVLIEERGKIRRRPFNGTSPRR